MTIAAITGDDGRLPLESERNTAAVAANALLQGEAPDIAVTLEIEKRMPLESGLGSSAASAVAAVVAVDALLGLDLPVAALLRYSLAGEILVDGSAHADNLAPSLLGGLVLVRSLEPIPDIVELPVPQGLTCAVVRPHINVNTREARSVLAPHLPLPHAVTQWGNCAALVAAPLSWRSGTALPLPGRRRSRTGAGGRRTGLLRRQGGGARSGCPGLQPLGQRPCVVRPLRGH